MGILLPIQWGGGGFLCGVGGCYATLGGGTAIVQGPFTPKPKITTGAGDHFNSGFCLGKLLGFDNAEAVLTGVATSGFYVKNAKSPDVADLSDFLNNWPA